MGQLTLITFPLVDDVPRAFERVRMLPGQPYRMAHSVSATAGSINTYGHVLEQRQRQVARAMDALLGG